MSLLEPSAGLFDTGVELDVVERGLRRALGTTKRCGQNKSITRIGENQGFFSRVGLLQCQWPEGTNLPSHVVIKITTLLNTIAMNNRGGKKGLEVAKKDKQTWNNKAAKLRKWHNNEVLFYETIQKLSSVECLPQLYCGRKFDEENQDIGFVCMEYADGCHIKHIYDNLSLKEVEKALVSMAEIQSIMDRVPETKRPDFGVSAYEELYADILNQDVLSFRLDELRLLDPSLSHLISEADLEASKLPSTKMVRRLHEDLGLGAVFVNGDMYSPNLLWKIDENGESQLHKMIDWQFCHYGCAAEDIVRLLITSTSTEDRRNSWEKWLRLYYTELEKRIEVAPFTLEQLTAAYRQLFSLAAFAFLGTVPEVYRAATQNCSEEEKRKRQQSMAAKVRGLLEDLLDYDNRKCG